MAFGNLLQGVPFHLDELLRPTYTGSFWALLNPFALLAGVVSLSMLVMHGAVWLQLRTTDAIEQRAQQVVGLAAIVMMAAFALAGIWLMIGIDGFRIVSQPALDALPNPLGKVVEPASGAWLENYSHYPLTLLAPLAGFGGAVLTMLLSRAGRAGLAFVTSAISMTGVIMTAGVSLFPFIMPSSSDPGSSFTVWDATSSHLTLTVMFWAVVVFLPIVLSYTVWTYYQMWGKLTVNEIRERAHSAY